MVCLLSSGLLTTDCNDGATVGALELILASAFEGDVEDEFEEDIDTDGGESSEYDDAISVQSENGPGPAQGG